MRNKMMLKDEFEPICRYEWEPLELVGNSKPNFIRGIPNHVLHLVIASGTRGAGFDYSSEEISHGKRMGGLEVFRYSPDDPVELNKDCYLVFTDPNKVDGYVVVGPNKDSEHWIDRVPFRFRGIKRLSG